MAKPYNDIFERLVERAHANGEPLVGFIAYSLYKRAKSEACQIARDEGTPKSQADLDAFHNSCCVDTVLEAFESQARTSLLQFVNVCVEQQREQIVRDAIGQLSDRVKSSVENLNSNLSEQIDGMGGKVEKCTGFWKAVWPGVVSSIVFSIGAAGLAILFTMNNPDFIRSVLQHLSPPPAVDSARPASQASASAPDLGPPKPAGK